MSRPLVLNPHVRIVPRGGTDVEVQIPGTGLCLPASAYLARLLSCFEGPRTLEEVLSEYPFESERVRAFVLAAEQGGALLPADARGRAVTPPTLPAAVPFLGAGRFDASNPAAFTVLGVPADLGTSGLPGARFGPAAIRQASEAATLTLQPGSLAPRGIYDYAAGRRLLEAVTVADAGDVVVGPGEGLSEVIGPRVTEAVRRIWDAGSIPLMLGGDHALTFFALAACQYEQVGVVHLDAHTDLGELEPALHHGNVFGHVLERLEPVTHIWQLGLRGFADGDPVGHERATGVGMDALRRDGLAPVLAQIPEDLPLYLSVDIDVVDPAFAPSTGTPVANGLWPHELKDILRQLCESRRVIGVDLMEVTASVDPADGTAQLALQAVLEAADGIVCAMRASLEAPSRGGES